MTLKANNIKKNNHEAHQALSDVSLLLSHLVKSRKAPSKIHDIIDLTREVARLGRALQGHGSDQGDGKDDGYGDRGHYARISEPSKVRGLIR